MCLTNLLFAYQLFGWVALHLHGHCVVVVQISDRLFLQNVLFRQVIRQFSFSGLSIFNTQQVVSFTVRILVLDTVTLWYSRVLAQNQDLMSFLELIKHDLIGPLFNTRVHKFFLPFCGVGVVLVAVRGVDVVVASIRGEFVYVVKVVPEFGGFGPLVVLEVADFVELFHVFFVVLLYQELLLVVQLLDSLQLSPN